MIIATGKAPIAPITRADDPRLALVRDALTAAAAQLAQAIVRDGEGATKFITIRVEGGLDSGECRRTALTIAHSPLVKTAFFASDPQSRADHLRDRQWIGSIRIRPRVVLARRRAVVDQRVAGRVVPREAPARPS